MRIAVASDHRGVALKEAVLNVLRSKEHDVEDVGASGSESVDYPDFASIVARKVSTGQIDRGILICGTGIGMSIAANKFRGVRAAPCSDEVTAEISRRHNNLNVLCLGGAAHARVAERMVEVWLNTEFEGGRHARRVEKIGQLESENGAC